MFVYDKIYKDIREEMLKERNKNKMKCCKTRLNTPEYVCIVSNFQLRKESIEQQFNVDLSIRPTENLNNEKDS